MELRWLSYTRDFAGVVALQIGRADEVRLSASINTTREVSTQLVIAVVLNQHLSVGFRATVYAYHVSVAVNIGVYHTSAGIVARHQSVHFDSYTAISAGVPTRVSYRSPAFLHRGPCSLEHCTRLER